MMRWGDRWLFPDGGRVELKHTGCGSPVHAVLQCERGTTSPLTRSIWRSSLVRSVVRRLPREVVRQRFVERIDRRNRGGVGARAGLQYGADASLAE